MQSAQALSLTPAVNDWLADSRHSRILHIFDHACNLINERREVLSIVTPQIGIGPFNLVIDVDIFFSEHINLNAKRPISNFPNYLSLGSLMIHTADAKLWSPHPDWEMLHGRKGVILEQVTKLSIADYLEHGGFDCLRLNHHSLPILQFSNSLISALVYADTSSATKITSKLAGLGIGLTPAGDDFLMGAIYAAWVIHPIEIAKPLTTAIAETAAPLTTSLSAAWLRSAGKGEAGILWHEFFDALSHPVSNLQLPITKLLSIGHTSGADALAGFFGVITASKNV